MVYIQCSHCRWAITDTVEEADLCSRAAVNMLCLNLITSNAQPTYMPPAVAAAAKNID